MQCYTVYFMWKLFYMFQVVPPPILKSANNCIYNIWYLSHRRTPPTKLKLNSVALVRERTIPTERPPPVGEVSANFCG